MKNPLVPSSRSWLPALTLAAAVLTTQAAMATSLQLGFLPPTSFNDSNRQAFLEWIGEPGKTYRVQSADSLSSFTEWKTEEPVTQTRSSVGPIRWMAPETIQQKKYYRLLLPQPEIHSLEPAFIDSSDTNALLYLTGQCLPTNGIVLINGQTFTPVMTDSNGTWIAISLNSLSAGTSISGTVQVVEGGSNVVAELPIDFPVHYDTAPTNEQLQGPPEEPPASPQALVIWASKKGYDYYKAQSDLAATASFASKKGYDYYQAQGSLRASKKGYDYYKARSDMAAAGMHNNPVFDDNSNNGTMPMATFPIEVKEKGNRTKCGKAGYGGQIGIGHPSYGGAACVIPPTGEVRCEAVDLAIPGRGMDFVWTRTYRSRTGPASSLGHGWDHAFNIRLAEQPDGTLQLCDGSGRCDTFYPDGTNGWLRAERFERIGDLNRDGMPDVLFADGSRWLFNPDGVPARGKVALIEDLNGNTIRCEYDPATEQLIRIVDTLDRTNTIAYNPAGLIVSVTDFTGRSVQYEYDVNGDLTAVISPLVTGTPNGNDFPGGKTNRFTYTSGDPDHRLNHNLTRIIDGKGQTQFQLVYSSTNDDASLDFDAVTSVLRGIEKSDIRRGMISAKPGSTTPHVRVIVNDPVGNVTETEYDLRYRPVEVREYTGRADPALPTTATDNRPSGRLRSSDPDFFQTRFAWNPDSLCTRILYPAGNSTEFIYQRAFNQNTSRSNRSGYRAHEGDLRVYRDIACCDQDDDGDGLVDELRWTFEYDSRFGSPARIGGRGTVATGRIETGLVPTIAQGVEKIPKRKKYGARVQSLLEDQWPCAGDSDFNHLPLRFTTRTTNPRGGVGTGDYDSAGRITRRMHFKEQVDAVWEEDYAYNSHGQMTAITNAPDANGRRRVDTISYHGSGAQRGYVEVIIVNALLGGLALSTAFEYDPRGNLTRCIDANTNDWFFTYNQLDQCVKAESAAYGGGPGGPVRNATTYSYDESDNLLFVDVENRDADGNPGTNGVWRTRFVYDALNRLTACWRDKNGALWLRCTAVEYDGNDTVVLYRSGEAVNANDTNAVTRFVYDERDLLFQEIAAPGTPLAATNELTYDANGWVPVRMVHKDARDDIQRQLCFYDGFGRCIAIQDAMGNATTFAYDRNGNLTSERCYGELVDGPGTNNNVLLAESTRVYDALDRLVFVFSEPVGFSASRGVTAYAYAPNGACSSVTDANGHATRYGYDTVGRLATVTDAKTNVTRYTYDACGNVLSVTRTDRSDLGGAAQQFSVTCAYDPLNRLIQSQDGAGNAEHFAYDSRDHLVRHTDPRGNDADYVYDGLGRCTQIRCYDGSSAGGVTISTSHIEYDDNDRVTATTDANGNSTAYAYDSLDRCVSTTEADGTSCNLVWSPRSNLVLEHDANGTVVSNSFDLLDRCVRRDINPGPGVAATTTYEEFGYDGLSRLVLASNDSSRVSFAYDSRDHCIAQTQDGLATTSVFDAVGNRLSLAYPSGRGVTCTYDALDQVSSITSAPDGQPPGLLVSYAYEGPGRPGRITRANNVNSRYQWNGLVSPPNAPGDFGFGRVSGVNHGLGGVNTVIDRRVASYDRSQNRTSRSQTVAFFGGGPTTTNWFDYDALDRLTGFIRESGSPEDYARQYILDPNGNRQTALSNGVAAAYTLDPTLPDPADFQMNQYTTTPSGSQVYDANGNLVGRGSAVSAYQYTYDYADRLVQVDDLTSGLAEPVAAYRYDALGRRVLRILAPGTAEEVVCHYLLAPDGRTLELRENGLLRRVYVLPEVNDEVLVAFDGGGSPQYYLNDDLGNVLALTDAAGNVLERYDYDDFGAPLFLSADGFDLGTRASLIGNPHLFQGMEWDPETGFYHDGAGDYVDPQTGAARKRPGRVKYSENTLKRGYVAYNDGNPWSPRSHGSSQATGHRVWRPARSHEGGVDHWLTPLPSPCARAVGKEEGGRHTPFHNKYRPMISDFGMSRGQIKADTYVWKLSAAPGLAHLHAEGVVHRDIAARNVLVSNALRASHDAAMNSVRNLR